MTPAEIVDKMYQNDEFSQWLGINIVKLDIGYAMLEMRVRNEMTNGFDIAHGGISYALADSAFAFASNSHGRHAVSVETSISHTRPIFSGDKLIAEAQVQNFGKQLGRYEVKVKNQDEKTVALFKGTVFIKDEIWK